MFEPQHHGLIFSSEQIAGAKERRDQPVITTAWDALNRMQPVDLLERLHVNAARYTLLDDDAAGSRGLGLLERAIEILPETDDPVGRARVCFSLMQAIDLLSSHLDFSAGQQVQVGDWLNAQIERTQQRPGDVGVVERLWSGVVLCAAGIVLEQEPLFQQAVDLFKAAVDREVRPEGYLKDAVDFPEVESLRNQLLSAQALTLMAEMATKSGVNLWQYENRSVSARTAATYPLYYYYYSEEWPWNGDQYKPSDGVELETAQALFKQHAGFLELTRPRFERPLKAIQMILDELRPVYDLYGGGPVTLLLAPIERKRRGFLKWL